MEKTKSTRLVEQVKERQILVDATLSKFLGRRAMAQQPIREDYSKKKEQARDPRNR